MLAGLRALARRERAALRAARALEACTAAAGGGPGRQLHTGGAALAIQPAPGGVAEIFDGELKRAHRDRAAFLRRGRGEDPLQAEIAERLLDRLEDCRAAFPRAAVLGGASESVLRRLAGGRAGIREVTCLDEAPGVLDRLRQLQQEAERSGEDWPTVHTVRIPPGQAEVVPLEPGSMDVVISCLGLHWVNDVPGVMAQCRRALRPDGLFLSAVWGGNTLQELRIACQLAEEATEGGVSQRVSPLVQVRDAGNLLSRAGLAIPSVDIDELTVHYSDLDALAHHLRAMGESNAVRVRRPRLRKETWAAAQAAYRSTLTEAEAAAGGIPATFEAVYMTGWAPHARQQQPAERGSATVSFKDLERALRKEQPEP